MLTESNVKIYSFRGSTNDQMGFYDYSFNNNYLLFQNNPANYNSFDYPATPSTYHDYNSLPSYNNFSPNSSQILGSSYRHSSASSVVPETSKFAQPKSESMQVTNSDSISLEKLQSIIHNTSEHVHELNQMCQIKDPKEFEKGLSSELSNLLLIFKWISHWFNKLQPQVFNSK